MRRRDFERVVERCIASIPETYRDHFENLIFVVEDRPDAELLAEAGYGPDEELLGYYRGFPLRERLHDLVPLEPDMIYLFQEPIEAEAAECRLSLAQVIRETVVHEVAHYFGFSEEEMDRIEALWAGEEP